VSPACVQKLRREFDVIYELSRQLQRLQADITIPGVVTLVTVPSYAQHCANCVPAHAADCDTVRSDLRKIKTALLAWDPSKPLD